MKNRKTVFWFVSIVAVFMICNCKIQATELIAAQQTTKEQTEDKATADHVNGTGLGQIEVGEPENVVMIGEDELTEASEAAEADMISSYSRVKAIDWSAYADSYVYDHLNETEKTFYQRIEELALVFATTDKTAVETSTGSGNYYTGLVDVSDLNITSQRAVELAMIFRYTNGQYYYLKPTVWRKEKTVDGIPYCTVIGIGIYPEYTEGEVRDEVSAEFFGEVQKYADVALTKSTDFEKQKAVYEKLCKEVSYVSNDYDQSAVSALLIKQSVCGGYAQAYEVICNYIGIPCVSVTSIDHEWNKVKLGQYWYNVDVTWDDMGSYASDKYLAKSDKYYATYSLDSAATHTQRSMWDGLLPSCDYDMDENGQIISDSDEQKPEEIEKPSDTTDPKEEEKPSEAENDPSDTLEEDSTLLPEKSGFVTDADGKTRYYGTDGQLVHDRFVTDGEYTYFIQTDGTPMTDRLTYHPDGEHIIYFDENGHEVFDHFAHVKKSIAGDPVDDLCYFNTFGYMYVDVLTYDITGTYLYYANPYGVMERSGWFRFSDGGIGYANADGTLMVSKFTYDQWGRVVYLQGNGHVATGTITDGVYRYEMDRTDGHLIRKY